MYSLRRTFKEKLIPVDCQIYIFEKTIEPILLYGAEILGFSNTGCVWSMTRFQQALKGAFFKISTCDLLQIVGMEKGIFFIFDTWRYLKNCENASD